MQSPLLGEIKNWIELNEPDLFKPFTQDKYLWQLSISCFCLTVLWNLFQGSDFTKGHYYYYLTIEYNRFTKNNNVTQGKYLLFLYFYTLYLSYLPCLMAVLVIIIVYQGPVTFSFIWTVSPMIITTFWCTFIMYIYILFLLYDVFTCFFMFSACLKILATRS